MKAISTPTGSIRIATSALRTCSRNTMQTSATMSAFLEQRALQRVDGAVDQVGAVVDRLDRRRPPAARSSISSIFALTLWITSSAFWP